MRPTRRSFQILCFVISLSRSLVAQITPAETIAARYSLSANTVYPFPDAPLNGTDAAESFMNSNGWGLSRARVQNNPQNILFVANPFPDSSIPSQVENPQAAPANSPVMQVTYPAGSFSNGTGGTQFYALYNSSLSSQQAMMLQYEVAFENGFDFVKGGKLPGIRGGPEVNGCSGGNKPRGNECFSFRLMWRTRGIGELYAYIPTPNRLCDQPGIACNPDFGTSIDRGLISFPPERWNRITLFVWLNSPVTVANGYAELYFNDVPVIQQGDLVLRRSEEVQTGGLYFSTFFGGEDDSWATPSEQHTYFRNIRLWAGASPSNRTGQPIQSNSAIAAGSPTLSALAVTLIGVVPVALALL